MKITADTDIAEILAEPRSKPKLVKLAQMVFDRTSVDCFRAFSQFRNTDDLAALIEAKRKNVFNYAACIRNTDSGVIYPKDTAAVVGALAKAMDGRYDEIDLRLLGLVDGEGDPLVKMSDLCPGAQKPASKKKKTPTRAKKVKDGPSAAEEAEIREERKAAQGKKVKAEMAAERAEREAALRQTEEEEPEVTVEADDRAEPRTSILLGSAEVLNELASLRTDLADSLNTVVQENKKAALLKNDVLEDEIGYLKADLEQVKGAILGLAAFLHVVNENIATMFAYIDPEEELEGPPQRVLDLLSNAKPEGFDDAPDDGDAVFAKEQKKVRALIQEEVVVPIEEEVEEETALVSNDEEDDEDDGEEVVYTRADLQAMDLKDLRAFASKVGVANASSIPYRTSLINRVTKAAGIK